jgi:hypothetical protein
MTLPVTTEQAMLDPQDRARFQQAAEARDPLYQRGGMVPAEVLEHDRWKNYANK